MLDERLGRRVAVDRALDWAGQMLAGVAYAHRRRILHCDLKPDNFILFRDGRLRLADFGLARIISRTLTASGSGTVGYMAPEQARGRALDRRSDIWAFGVVLWEMLTGHAPFQGDTASDGMAAILTHDSDPSRLPAGTPGAARALLARCLRRDSNRWLRDIGDARITLEEVRSGDAIEPEAAPAPTPPRTVRRRFRVS